MLSLRLAQAGDLSLLKTMLQQFAAFERLAVTVTEADLLRDVQIHLPVLLTFKMFSVCKDFFHGVYAATAVS